MPTPTEETGQPATGGTRTSVLEAQVMGMRSSAMAIAEMLNAFAIQCDTLLLTLRVMGQMTGQPGAGAAPASPVPPTTVDRATFGRKPTAPPPDVDDLTDRVAEHSPS